MVIYIACVSLIKAAKFNWQPWNKALTQIKGYVSRALNGNEWIEWSSRLRYLLRL